MIVIINLIMFICFLVYVPRGPKTINFIHFIGLSFVLSISDFSLITIFVCILLYASFDYYFFNDSENVDFLTLVLFAQACGALLLSFTDFMSAFLALEAFSLTSYVLVGFLRNHKLSVHTGIKYLIISAVPTLFLVLGISVLYKSFGSFYYDMFSQVFLIDNKAHVSITDNIGERPIYG